MLADAAKYDVSCSSAGSKRANKGGLGNSTGMGICHSYAEDGRCISLLKILLTNYCDFDCAYCINRKSNDIKRAAFSVKEVVELTINFYRRNYIEGLFLSSGIIKNADYTMEKLVEVARRLREEENFFGYIHLKTIPGASQELIDLAALHADRLSVNIEIPSEENLKLLAPEKNYQEVLEPMAKVRAGIEAHTPVKKGQKLIAPPKYAPAGQSTQLVVGATPDDDRQILKLSQQLYDKYKLKRIYYSGYIPVADDDRLPALDSKPPLLREHRLYQADWLMRFYGFHGNELLPQGVSHLDDYLDPKTIWALNNMQFFPIDVNTASRELLLRVPGIGGKSLKRILEARKFGRLNFEHVTKMGVVMKRAKYFLKPDKAMRYIGAYQKELTGAQIRAELMRGQSSKFGSSTSKKQLSLFGLAA